MAEQFVICVDFDGTITEYAFPDCGPPRAHVVEALRRLKDAGWKVIIHSSRVNSQWPPSERSEKVQAMVFYLSQHRIPHDEIWGLHLGDGFWEFEEYQTGKPVAHVYLDDRAVNPEPERAEERRIVNRDAYLLAYECERIAAMAEKRRRGGQDRGRPGIW